ncbi:MAG TPA: YceH family protein [Thermoanaerobaculia bacterium]|nr:YceH family protein [Thermoanaerobaculia bacterium]
MSSRSVSGLDGDDRPSQPKLSRPLDEIEVRLLGSLMEKQQTTPEYYPLTVNSLLSAANQKTNRDPVTELSESDVSSALERLQDLHLAWRIVGGRATRWEHNLDRRWHLGRGEKALMTLLLLRGPQTVGELRSRTERMFTFGSIDETDGVLAELAASSEPLVIELPRSPGQKEARWMHLAGGPVEVSTPSAAPSVPSNSMTERIERLEGLVETLTNELRELKNRLGES